VRILLISALLVATASCALPPPPPGEVAGTIPPPPPPAPVFYVANPFAFLFAPILPGAPPPGRLTLSNFSFDHARVETLITPYPDCAPREGTAASNFELPLNGTRVIEAAPGSDVCWRRQIAAGKTEGVAPTTPGWTEWNRVYLSSVPVVDSRL
jgi:hypothetical protein